MKKVLPVMILTLSSACATISAPPPGMSAYEHRIAQLEAKNALLAKKVVRLTMDKAARERGDSLSLVDYTAPAVAVRPSALEKVANRLIARVDLPDGRCDTKPGALVVKNGTGQHMILLVDGRPTAVVYATAVTDYVGPGVSVHLCLDNSVATHELSGGVFPDLKPGTKASKVFVLEKQLSIESVTTVNISEDDLSRL